MHLLSKLLPVLIVHQRANISISEDSEDTLLSNHLTYYSYYIFIIIQHLFANITKIVLY